jgi:glycosyltransferase involved in cell wall biosynthesis
LHAQKAKRNRDDIRLFSARLLPGLLTAGQVEIAQAARRQKLSLIHDPTGCAPLVFTGARRVLTLHDVIPYIYPQTSTKLDWLIYHLWLPKVVRRIDAIITVSEQSKRDIVRYLSAKPEKITVIPEAASPLYRPIDPIQKESRLLAHGIDFPYILYIGSIEARKNLIVLLEAYAQLRHWSQKWKLVIVGARKWKYTPVFNTLERLQLSSYVHFTGYIPEADLPALYNGASLFVFPSLYEGFGLPVLEAMACGTPVITSNCSSLPEVTADAAILIHPMDVNAITLAIRRVLEEPDLAISLRQKGIARARHYSWESTARKTIAIYEGLLNETLI